MAKYIDETVVMKRMKSRLLINKIWKSLFLIATSFA
ncbi:MAG: phosphate ABC transporter, permease protein PstA, partial [Lysinibacillus sp.]|nr:phosphate ABC transporter, permease protein PstA [Lysinibacillus sp.]